MQEITRKKIMIVEDDKSIQDELTHFLENNQFQTIVIQEFETIIDRIKMENPDLILLDIELVNRDGYEVSKEIRLHSNIPIIFVTAKNTIQDEIKGMQLGGDDYITKPYNLTVLLARIESLLRRSNPDYSGVVHYHDFSLIISSQIVSYQEDVIELTKIEFRILYYFFLNQNRELSKDEIIEYLWINKAYIDENALSVNFARIRKKLKEKGFPTLIKNSRNNWYQL